MASNPLVLIFQLIVLLFSVIIHEISHGAMALRLGDRTAKDAGRLTLNPLKHLDLFGSVILPLSLFLLSGGSMILGWAKPVPYNPLNLKNPKRDAGLIGAVGPLSNLALAAVFGIFIRILLPFANVSVVAPLILLFNIVVFINLLLAVFNLMPLAPLDGANILFAALPERWQEVRIFLQRYGFFLLMLLIFFGFRLLMPLIGFLHKLIVGTAALL